MASLRNYKASHDLPILAKMYKTLSPTKLARIIEAETNTKITKQAVSIYFKRHPELYTNLQKSLNIQPRPIKHLRFELGPKEYSDFWYIGSLLGLTKKHKILVRLMEEIKHIKERS